MKTLISWRGFARQIAAIVCSLLALAVTSSLGFASRADAQAQIPNSIWSDVTLSQSTTDQRARPIVPQRYRTLSLDVNALQALLHSAPSEGSGAARNTEVLFNLPLPNGGFGRFQIVESPIMDPALAAQFPEIKTYAGKGIDDPNATVRFDWTPTGLHAMILSTSDTVFIDPYSLNDTAHYISYFKSDYVPTVDKMFSEAPDSDADALTAQEIAALRATIGQKASGTQLRTYRLAIAADGEYTKFHGGTVNGALAAIVTTINRVDGIYEREVAVRLVLVANNHLLIYTDPNTDPYTNSDSGSLIAENQANIDKVIGTANYDVGHVFSTGGGGMAGLGVVCRTGSKARGETGSASPVGDAYDVDYVAHELGHEFGANHTFNDNSSGACTGNRDGTAAYEPGSGTTIMAYAGICSGDNIQAHSDPYFSTISFDEIVAYTTAGNGSSCGTTTNTGNTAPVPNAGASYTIPKQTPFTLTGSATDADNDALTYTWEEFDLGPASVANNPANPPFFRFFPPTTSPSRTFPQWSDIINNKNTLGEILPNSARTMTFRFTARDNKANGGGVNYASTTVTVAASGPFKVTAPDTAVTWAGGSAQNVTWDVAGTNAAPVNCANVNILLSTDGGLTYPTTLAANAANNGAASVTAPNLTTTSARVQVVCANSIFFDISNANFTINISGVLPTATSMATATPTSTKMPTNTPMATANATPPATNTPIAPTATPIKTPIGATATPTKTPIAPTATPTKVAATPTLIPTLISTPTSQPQVNIQAYTYNDLDDSGQPNQGENYLSRWIIRLYDSKGITLTTGKTAQGTGMVTFKNLPTAEYTVCEDKVAGWSNTQAGEINPLFGDRPCYTLQIDGGYTAKLYFGNHATTDGVSGQNADGEMIQDGDKMATVPQQTDGVNIEPTPNNATIYLPVIQAAKP